MDGSELRAGIERVAGRLQTATHTGEIAADGERPEDVTIEPLHAEDIPAAAAVITAAFRPENFTTAAFGGNGDTEQAGFRTLIEAELRVCFDNNQPLFVARTSPSTDTTEHAAEEHAAGDIVGVVILMRPGFEVTTFSLVRRLAVRPRHAVRLLRAVKPGATRRVLNLHEPPADITADNYTLEYIAVRPDRQGEGIGGALLDTVHEFTDRDPGAVGTYLVTAGEYTRDIYASHGYETVERRVDETLEGDDGPLYAWHMRRPRGE